MESNNKCIQVKQRKKSSNKWTCVVCNQKQSVLKVFAQGPMAKDLRKFVQSFNMSRKFANQNQSFDPAFEYDINFEDDDAGDLDNPKKKRTDWTEYLDPEDHHDHKLVLQEEEQGVDSEAKIVTELPPKEKFKRPKLRNYQIGESGDQLYKPVFSQRNSRNKATLISQDEKPVRQQQQTVGDMGTSASKWNNVRIGNVDESMRESKPATAKGNSKWIDYIAQDEGDSFRLRGSESFAEDKNKWGEAVLKTESKYQMVEDDIHPDFM
ncbi:hypothetical protein DITRI_Ditri05aG0161900 [Diplodiscus trichospermus]